ncbi:MAG TPA: hypothetical protein VFR14_03490 [Candidatus Limnocylindrales bacterium]|nr:hypothetical protein [Candidatus Limnocylindrales bacterium]
MRIVRASIVPALALAILVVGFQLSLFALFAIFEPAAGAEIRCDGASCETVERLARDGAWPLPVTAVTFHAPATTDLGQRSGSTAYLVTVHVGPLARTVEIVCTRSATVSCS